MNAYKADCGAIYWIVAPCLPEAMRALANCWDAEGTGDASEHVTIDEVPTAELGEIKIRDDGTDTRESLAEIAAKAKVAEVVACSEWP